MKTNGDSLKTITSLSISQDLIPVLQIWNRKIQI